MHNRAARSNSAFCLLMLCAALVPTAQSQNPGLAIEYPNPEVVHSLQTSAMRIQIGPGDGVDFHRIAAILPLKNGGFVVVNAGTSELLFFEASGDLSSSVGRSGAGPGEYSYIRDVALLTGDSILVFDTDARRISVLDPQGAFVRSFPLTSPFEGGGSPTSMTALRDGTVLVGYSEIRAMAPHPDPVYFGQRLFRYSTTGVLSSSNGLSLPESEHFVQAVPPSMGGVAYWGLAFGRRLTIRADSSWILTGDGTDWTVEQRTPEGVIANTHRLTRSTEPVTAQDRQLYRRRILAASQPTQRAVAERMVRDMPYPQSKPAYRRFEVDELGRLWLEAYSLQSDSGALWIRLDRRASHAVAVQLPPRFRAFAFTANFVYGVWRDSDDVEQVQVFALEQF